MPETFGMPSIPPFLSQQFSAAYETMPFTTACLAILADTSNQSLVITSISKERNKLQSNHKIPYSLPIAYNVKTESSTRLCLLESR